MAASELRISASELRASEEKAALELRASQEVAASRIDMLTRLLDMRYHGDYSSWRGEYHL